MEEKVEKLFEEYKTLTIREKIRFKKLIKEEEEKSKVGMLKAKLEAAVSIIEENEDDGLSVEWIIKNILNIGNDSNFYIEWMVNKTPKE